MSERLAPNDLAALERLQQQARALKDELHQVIVGQDEILDQILLCIFSRGHCLLIGVPGLAKTLMIRTLSEALALSFNRIQFTPDLMPSDITGTEVIQEDKASGTRGFHFLRGPIFANIILADEINRTPPKTQAALLEAMQEYQVTAGGTKHTLAPPFFVLATQNPIEQEGTYPLPEAQQDRFMFNVLVDYPTADEELQIMQYTTAERDARVTPVVTGAEILAIQDLIRRMPCADEVIRYAMALTRATRVSTPEARDFVKRWVAWGAGPRATQYLILGAKAWAALQGKHAVSRDDIRAVAHPVLRHRVIRNFSAEAEGVTPDHIIDQLLAAVEKDAGALKADARLPQVT